MANASERVDLSQSAGLALLDWDGTLRPGFMVEEWVSFLEKAGVASRLVVDEVSSLMMSYRSGHLEHDSLAELSGLTLAAAVAGSDRRTISALAHEFVESDQHRLRPFTRGLTALLDACQLTVVLISGAPSEPLGVYAAQLGINRFYGLDLASRDSKYSGRVETNPGVTEEKRRILTEVVAESGLSVRFAIGDSPSDAPLFAAAQIRAFVVERRGPQADPSMLEVTGIAGDLKRIELALKEEPRARGIVQP